MTPYTPTPTMLRVLREIHDGYGTHHRCATIAQNGGRARILIALRRRGFVTMDHNLTYKGKELVKETAHE